MDKKLIEALKAENSTNWKLAAKVKKRLDKIFTLFRKLLESKENGVIDMYIVVDDNDLDEFLTDHKFQLPKISVRGEHGDIVQATMIEISLNESDDTVEILTDFDFRVTDIKNNLSFHQILRIIDATIQFEILTRKYYANEKTD